MPGLPKVDSDRLGSLRTLGEIVHAMTPAGGKPDPTPVSTSAPPSSPSPARGLASHRAGPARAKSISRQCLRLVDIGPGQASGLPLPDAFALEDAAKREVMRSQDAREGPLAFIEKRAPRFVGR